VTCRDAIDTPWQEPQNLGANVNSKLPEDAVSISADMCQLYFIRRLSESNAELYVSERASTHDHWGKAVSLGPTINSPRNDTDPDISRDGLTLFFASHRSGGKGGTDLWMTQRTTRTEPWCEPVCLGAPINTPGWEESPCLSADGQWLFFSGDDWEESPDWFDLMVSRRNEDGSWSTPINLTNQFDLPDEVVPLCLSGDQRILYFCSYHNPDSKMGVAIWQIPIEFPGSESVSSNPSDKVQATTQDENE
jgi:hypothetical protein